MTNFVQWLANKVEHNIPTLIAKETLHENGNSKTSLKLKDDTIGCLECNNNVGLLATLIRIRPYLWSVFDGLLNVKLKPIRELTANVNNLCFC